MQTSVSRPAPPVAALVVAQDEVIRLGLRMLLLRHVPAVRAVLEAQDRYEAIKFAGTSHYDIAVVHVTRHNASDAYTVVGDIASRRPDMPFILYTDDPTAAAYCERMALRCERLAPGPGIARNLLRAMGTLLPQHFSFGGGTPPRGKGGPACVATKLTCREREILTFVASGHASKEIAQLLGVSLRTVESHRSSICAKLGVRTVAELTKAALKAGFTSLDE
jgi:DNA-binding NarL/FixJ family response regulator